MENTSFLERKQGNRHPENAPGMHHKCGQNAYAFLLSFFQWGVVKADLWPIDGAEYHRK